MAAGGGHLYGATPDGESVEDAARAKRSWRLRVVVGAAVLALMLVAAGQLAGGGGDGEGGLLSVGDREDGMGMSAQLGGAAGDGEVDERVGQAGLMGGARRGFQKLMAMSGLKPRVEPMPDQYFNVFDPKNKTRRPHAFWKSSRLRFEVRIGWACGRCRNGLSLRERSVSALGECWSVPERDHPSSHRWNS